EDLGRSQVESDPRMTRDRTPGGSDLDARVETLREAREARIGDHVTASEVRSLDAREVHRHPLPVGCAWRGDAVHLQTSNPRRIAGGEDAYRVAFGDCTGDRRPGHDDPVSAHDEGAIDRQPEVPGARFRWRRGELRGDPISEDVETGSRHRRHRDDRRTFEGRVEREDLDLLADGRDTRLVDEIRLRDNEDPAPDTEEMENVQMLLGLRHHPVVRGDREEDEVHPVRAGEHVPDEPLVPGHVDDPGALAVGSVEEGEAEIDRDAALLLLLQTVRVLPGERTDQGGLPVVDVPGGPDDHGHGQDPRSTASSAGSKMPRKSSRKRPSWMRPSTGGCAARNRAAIRSGSTSACSIARARLSTATTGTAPLPTSHSEATTSMRYPSPRRLPSSAAAARPVASRSASGRVSQRRTGRSRVRSGLWR